MRSIVVLHLLSCLHLLFLLQSHLYRILHPFNYYSISRPRIGHGAGAFEESQVIDNQRNRTAVSRTQNISHANMSDKAFERMCETGEVPDLDGRPKKRKAGKEDSGKKGKKVVVEEEDDDDDDEEEEEDTPKNDRRIHKGASASGKSDLKTPSKGKGSKRSQESNGEGDSDSDDEAIELRNTPNSSRRSKGR